MVNGSYTSIPVKNPWNISWFSWLPSCPILSQGMESQKPTADPTSAIQKTSILWPPRSTRTSSITTIVAHSASSGLNRLRLVFESTTRSLINCEKFTLLLDCHGWCDGDSVRLFARHCFCPIRESLSLLIDRWRHVSEDRLRIDAEEDGKGQRRRGDGNLARGHRMQMIAVRALV